MNLIIPKRMTGLSGFPCSVRSVSASATRRALILACLVGSLATLAAQAADPRSLLKEGTAQYQAGDYTNAVSLFTEAAETAKEKGLDPAVATYNLAAALAAAGRTEEAEEALAEAARTENLTLQSQAYYNRGNLLMQGIDALAEQGQTDVALQKVGAALESYEQAIALSPGDIDAKANFEIGMAAKARLEELQQQQQQQNQDDSEQDENDEGKEEQQQDQQDQQDGDESEEEEEQQNQQQGQQDQQQEPSPEQQSESRPSEEMTPEEARMLLEAMKEEEAAHREQMQLMLGQPVPVEKDW